MTTRTEQTASVPPLPPLPPPAPGAIPPSGSGHRAWRGTPVFRDPDRGRVAGVIAGISRSFGFDLRTTRIAVAIATLVVPAILLVYIAAWLLLPPRPEEAVPLDRLVRDRRRLPLIVAIGIVIVAGGLGSLGSWFFFGGAPWGLVLIAIGVLLWASPSLLGHRDSDDVPPPPAPPGASSAPRASSGWPLPADAPVDTLRHDSLGHDTLGHDTQPHAGLTDTGRFGELHTPMAIPPVPPERPRRRRYPVATVALVAAIVTAAVASAGEAFDWWNAEALGVAVAVVSIVGLGLVLSALVNRSFVLVPLLVPFGAALTFLLVVQPNLDGGSGERTIRPATVDDATQLQQLAAGQLTIDLGGVPTGTDAPGADYTVRAEVGMGRLHVLVPDDVIIDLRADMGAGHVVLDGVETSAGIRADDDRIDLPAGVTDADTAGVRTVVLDLDVGAGEIDIDRVAAV